MSYRKLKADKIFDGQKFNEGSVLVVDDDGIIEEIVSEGDAGGDVEIYEGMLSPGFINCHCHLELSHMKGCIPEQTGLVDFVFKVITQRHYPEEEVLQAVADAEDEMMQNGIVAVGDICNNTLTLAQKQKQRLCYYNFIEASGWLPSISQARFERAKRLLEEFSILNSLSSIVPHAPYSVSENLWQQIQPYFKNKVVSIHNQETAFEDEFFLSGTGDFNRMYELMKIDNTHYLPTKKSSLKSYFDKLTNAANIILVHNTFIRQGDIDYVKQQTEDHSQTFFCLCVNSNQYIEGVIPPIDLLSKNRCTIVLGTDSLASTRSLNIIDEIKTIRNFFPGLSLQEMLQWATLNGSKALQMEDTLGSFEKGKKPGVLLINEELAVKKLI
ncbi:MAG: amidohydrolase family protein [Chitinophagaceae bacterium]|nr:amidohydrolase family protein [Chitinophagaceae bacterium]